MSLAMLPDRLAALMAVQMAEMAAGTAITAAQGTAAVARRIFARAAMS
jgi:hypothetical protein